MLKIRNRIPWELKLEDSNPLNDARNRGFSAKISILELLF